MMGLKSWKIARIRGVDVNLHISLLLLLPYLVLAIGSRFGSVARDAGVSAEALSFGAWGWGFICALGLFASILIHEFGHVMVAQTQGTRVDGVTLMMLGGLSTMDRPPERPFAEFRLAIIGPLVSLALAGYFLALESASTQPDLKFLGFWLSRTNLALAVFNLLPAFPMDGGRALRSLLAVKRGQLKATQTAVKVSTVFAWSFGVMGALSLNIILLLIAFFIFAGAQTELAFLLSRGLLKGIRAGDVAIEVSPIAENQNLIACADRMIKERQTVLPVITTSGESALVSLGRIRTIPSEFRDTTRVRDIMSVVRRSLDKQEAISDALSELATSPGGSLPVTSDGKIIGIVRAADLNEVLQLKRLEESAILSFGTHVGEPTGVTTEPSEKSGGKAA